MADRRSSIVLDVAGLKELRDMNRALTDHVAKLRAVGTAYEAFGGSSRFAITALLGLSTQLGKVTGGLEQQKKSMTDLARAQGAVTKANQEVSRSAQDVGRNLDRTHGSMGNLFAMAIKYRAISLVFHEVTDAVRETFAATMEFEKQMSRVRRVTEGNVSTGTVRAGMYEEMARTGEGAKELGEAFYQLGTFVKDTDTLLSAVRVTMNLVVGTESDVRDTARAVMQIYNQFGDQLDKTAGQAENFRRIGEAIAVTYRATNTEVSEIIQALKYLGPLAEAARVPVAQLFGVLGGLEAGGIRGRQAGTSASQFIAQLLKRSTEGDEIKAGKYVYGGIIQRIQGGENAGGLDLLATLTKIRDHLNQLNLKQHTHEADEFVIAMGGTQNAVRFVGTLTETLNRMRAVTDENTRAFRGLTHESERLKDIMQDNLPATMQRAWSGALVVMSKEFKAFADTLHITGLFRDWAALGQNMASEDLARGQMQQMVGGDRTSDRAMARAGILARVEKVYGKDQLGYVNSLGQYYTPSLGAIAARTGINQETLRTAFGGDTPPLSLQKAIGGYQEEAGGLREQEARDRRGLSREQKYGAVFDPTSGRFVHIREPGWSKPLGVTKHLSDAEMQAQERKREAANRKSAAKLNQQAKDKEDEAGALTDTIARRVRDGGAGPTVAERSHISGLREAAVILRAKAAALVGDLRMNRYERASATSEDKLDQLDKEASDSIKSKNLAMAKSDLEATRQMYGFTSRQAMEQEIRVDRATEAAANGDPATLYDLYKTRGEQGQGDRRREAYAHEQKGETFDEATGQWMRPIHAGFLWNISEESMRKHLPSADIERMREAAAGIDLEMETGGIGPLAGMQAKLGQAQQRVARYTDYTGIGGPEALKEAEQAVRRLTKAIHDYKAEVRERGVDLANELFGKNAEARIRAFGMSEMPVRAGLATGYGISRRQMEADLYLQLSREATDPAVAEGYRQKANEVQHGLVYDSAARRIGRQDEERGLLQGAATSGAIGMFHGTAGVRSTALGLGNEIVDRSITRFMEKLFDPQAEKMKQQIDAADRNTTAIDTLTATITGTNVGTATPVAGVGRGSAGSGAVWGVAGAVAAAVGLGDAAGGIIGGAAGAGAGGNGGRSAKSGSTRPTGRLPSDVGKWNTGNILSAGTAAYSVFNAGQSQGATLGNVLGAGMTGFELGGPVGAGIGVGLDLLGSLFHHAPKPQPKDFQPAMYHAPSDFDYYAYRFRSTGKVGMDVSNLPPHGPSPVITVNLITDGVKRAVKVELAAATQSGRAQTVNATYDMHSPL